MIKKSNNNIIYAPISVGELVDKITILENVSTNKFTEERKILKSLGYIK